MDGREKPKKKYQKRKVKASGEIEEALATEKEALAIAKKDRAYYQEQIARFEKALKAGVGQR